MIHSMTAYGRTEDLKKDKSISCEIRTVNHRYLEISIRLPEELKPLEEKVREYISRKLKRIQTSVVRLCAPNSLNMSESARKASLRAKSPLVVTSSRSCSSHQTSSLKSSSWMNCVTSCSLARRQLKSRHRLFCPTSPLTERAFNVLGQNSHQ